MLYFRLAVLFETKLFICAAQTSLLFPLVLTNVIMFWWYTLQQGSFCEPIDPMLQFLLQCVFLYWVGLLHWTRRLVLLFTTCSRVPCQFSSTTAEMLLSVSSNPYLCAASFAFNFLLVLGRNDPQTSAELFPSLNSCLKLSLLWWQFGYPGWANWPVPSPAFSLFIFCLESSPWPRSICRESLG